jgi:subtilisin
LTQRPQPHLPYSLLFILSLLVLLLAGWTAAAFASGPVTLHQRGIVEGHYIVVLDPKVEDPSGAAAELGRVYGFEVGFVYAHALKGFSAALPPAVAPALERNPLVRSVEPDRTVSIMAQTIPTGIARIFALENPNLGIDSRDDWRVDVDVAVLDTGIDAGHPDLNVVARTDCSGGSPFSGTCSEGGDDGNGHGTHVAGTIAAIDNGIGVVGVAPGARLWSVKVLDNQGSGYLSWLIAGIDWITARADTIAVANMSLGFEGSSAALDTAIANSVRAEVTYAVSAGNSSKDAATFSPANHPHVITVSALADFDGLPGGLGTPTCRSDEDDTLANFSNFGPVIDLAAPGVCILSTWPGNAYRSISGTSMAAPHVAGAAALLVAGGSITDPAAVRAALTEAGNFDWTDTSGDGIHEPLLDVGDSTLFAPAMVAGSEPGPGEPVATVTISSPSDGAIFMTSDIIEFRGAAEDGEGSILSKLEWSSSRDGSIGEGESFDRQLSAGGHLITAQITDPPASDSVNITVQEMAAGTHRVEDIFYTTAGGREKDRHLTVTVLVYADGQPAGDVSIAVEIRNLDSDASWKGTATTGADGEAVFNINNHPVGCYVTEVLSLNGEAPTEYSDPGYCK